MAKIKNMDVKIGCDPEFWVKKNGQIVSAYGLIPGTKAAPYKVKDGAVQVDGMALEFNINPADSKEEFVDNISSVLNTMKKMTPGYEFVFEPVAVFGKAYINSQPEEAKVLGCEPDFNAYTKAPNPTPNGNVDFRTASGHIHISWKDTDNKQWPDVIDPFDPTHLEACYAVTKVLDAYLGFPSLAWDRDTKRRQLYGKAGSFRPKTYGKGYHGLEYRPLSNKWLNYPQCIALMYGNTMLAIQALQDDWELQNATYSGVLAADVLNNADQERMQQIAGREFERGKIKAASFYRAA